MPADFSEIGLLIFATTKTPMIINGMVTMIPLKGSDALAVMIILATNMIGVISSTKQHIDKHLNLKASWLLVR